VHEQLVAARGLYAQLWARQSGGFIDNADKAAAPLQPAQA